LTFFFDEDFAAGWSSVFVGVSSVDVTGFGRILGLLDVLGGLQLGSLWFLFCYSL
jgi:hypothetical protein